MRSETASRILTIAAEVGVLRPRDLVSRGIRREVASVWLGRLSRQGLLRRSARGLYILPASEPTEHHTVAQVCKRIPRGVVCLISALRFHELTTQMPFEVWLAVDRKARRPVVSDLPVRIVRFSGAALDSGVEEHTIEGVPVRMFSPEKTVADCFKYRHKYGLDVAIDALRDCLRRRTGSADEIWRHAKICRVANVMRPYLEAMA
jgi:predicted transcriptional regulator of viral defense system